MYWRKANVLRDFLLYFYEFKAMVFTRAVITRDINDQNFFN